MFMYQVVAFSASLGPLSHRLRVPRVVGKDQQCSEHSIRPFLQHCLSMRLPLFRATFLLVRYPYLLVVETIRENGTLA